MCKRAQKKNERKWTSWIYITSFSHTFPAFRLQVSPKSLIFAEKLTTMEYVYDRKTPQKSSGIAQCQERLNYIRKIFHGNWRYITPDGIFGRGTRDAVRQFQVYANISVTGNLDNPTQAHIVLYYDKAKKGYTPAPKAPVSNYQPVSANYTAAPSADFVPVSRNTSSFVDSEWKSLGKDVLSIVEEMAKKTSAADLKTVEAMRKRIADTILSNDATVKRIRASLDRQLLERLNSREMREAAAVDDYMKRVYGAKTHLTTDLKSEALAKRATAEFDLRKLAGKLNKEVEDAAKMADATADAATKAGRVAKGAAVANWAINIGTAGYYIHGMVTAQSDEEYKQYATKLKDTIGTTAIDVGITLGGNIAARAAAGAAGGPAGLVVVGLITVLDVVLLAATGESLSTKIWNFIKSIDWEKVQVYYDYAYMDHTGRRSFGPKY